MGKPVLGYWDIRGRVQQIRLLLQYLGVEYEDKLYGFGSGPEPSWDEWQSEKFTHGLDFPNVPYWIEDNFKLTESMAILKYVALTRGPQTVPANAKDQAVADQLQGVATDLQMALAMLVYSKTGIPESPLEVALAGKFEQLEAFLSKRKWVVGDQITYVDFYLYEVFHHFQKFNKDFFKPYPTLEKYIQAFESLPQLSEYVKASDHLKCYSPFATIKI